MFETMETKRIGMGVFDGNDPENFKVPGSISFRVKSITTPEMCTVNGELVGFGKAGDEVTVTAPAVEGKLFTAWGDDAEGITVTDPNAESLTFTMPEGGVTLTATYEDDPNYTPPTSEEPTTDEPTTDEPTTEEPTDTPDNSNEGTTEPTGTAKPADKDDDKGGLHPAIIAVIAVVAVAVVVVIIVVVKKKK